MEMSDQAYSEVDRSGLIGCKTIGLSGIHGEGTIDTCVLDHERND